MLDSKREDKLFTNILLEEALEQLTPIRRTVVALRSAGYTQQECGAIIGLTGVAVGLIHRRALLQLRQFFEWYERKSYETP